MAQRLRSLLHMVNSVTGLVMMAIMVLVYWEEITAFLERVSDPLGAWLQFITTTLAAGVTSVVVGWLVQRERAEISDSLDRLEGRSAVQMAILAAVTSAAVRHTPGFPNVLAGIRRNIDMMPEGHSQRVALNAFMEYKRAFDADTGT